MKLLPIRYFFVILAISNLSFQATNAQNADISNDTKKIEIYFDEVIGLDNSLIVNGKEYFNSFKGLKTDPFFISSYGDTGTVQFNEDTYRRVPLLYDVYTDKLILKKLDKYSSVSLIELNKEDVESFRIFNHNFRKFNYSTTPTGEQEFFDVIFESPSLILASKRSKIRYVEESSNRVELTPNDLFFLVHKDQWIPVKGKRNFLSLTNDKKKREIIRSFIKQNHIRINKKDEKDLKNLTEFCNALLLAPS